MHGNQTYLNVGIRKMIDVKENKDGSFLISWDKDDPIESRMNTWTEQDFIDAIKEGCNQIELSKFEVQRFDSLSGTVFYHEVNALSYEHAKNLIQEQYPKEKIIAVKSIKS